VKKLTETSQRSSYNFAMSKPSPAEAEPQPDLLQQFDDLFNKAKQDHTPETPLIRITKSQAELVTLIKEENGQQKILAIGRPGQTDRDPNADIYWLSLITLGSGERIEAVVSSHSPDVTVASNQGQPQGPDRPELRDEIQGFLDDPVIASHHF
jgi:hypothetical protein